jgi:tetratricopeptide (TPR) repeat protein
MTPRKLILAAAALMLCGGLGWRWARGHPSPVPSATASLDKLEAKAAWNDPKAQALLAIRTVTEARRTGDPALWDRAALAAQRALAQDPERLDAVKVQLLVMQNQHRFTEVEQSTRKLLEKHPADGFLNGLLGDAQLEMGRYEAAAAAYQSMVDDEPNAATYGRVAYLRLLEGDLDGAIEMGELAARAAPKSDPDAVAWALSDLGDVYFAREQPDLALNYFETALAYSPRFSRAIEGRGHALRALGRLSEAVDAYRATVAVAPTAQHHLYLGEALAAAGQTDASRAELDLARTAASGDARLEATLLLKGGADPVRALKLAEEELRRRQDVFTEDVFAYALLRNGKTAEAARASAHALRLGTRDARLSFHAGVIAAAQGDLASARRRFAEAVTLSPPLSPAELTEARQNLSQIAQATQPHLNHQ